MSEPAPSLSVAVVARRLGVAPDTLRTWDRRYGLGPTDHTAGSHRRYAPGDLARLEVMRRLTLEGVPACEAARVARVSTIQPVRGDADPAGPAGGGRVLALRGAAPTVRGLARAAMALDSAGMVGLIGAELERRGVAATWDEVLVPVLTSVGHRWESSGAGVEVEHLLSESVLAALRGVSARVQVPVNPRPVMAACAPDEQHSLPLHALAAALAERQVEVRVLGARVPSEALAAAVRRCGPAAVLVWSQDASTGDAAPLADLLAVRPPPAVLVGGPGWREPLPGGVRRVRCLAEAVESVVRAVGG